MTAERISYRITTALALASAVAIVSEALIVGLDDLSNLAQALLIVIGGMVA